MKKNKIIILIFLIFLLLAIIVINIANSKRIAVLGYHSFYKNKSELKEKNPEFINNIDNFEKQLKYLKKHNYKTLTMDEYYCWKNGKCKFPKNTVLITIDDGNLSNYMYAFPLLKKYNFNATVFFVGSYAEKFGVEKGSIYDVMSLKLIEKCKKEYPNIEFYSHSYDLHAKSISNYSIEQLKNDIEKMSEIGNYMYYAYPFGSYDDRMIKLLKEKGYLLAFGFGPKEDFRKSKKSDDNYKISRLNISNYVSLNKFKIRLLLPF